MILKSKDYDEAISNLITAKMQLEPDGHDCAICGDCDHQAFECQMNILVKAKMFDKIREYANFFKDIP